MDLDVIPTREATYQQDEENEVRDEDQNVPRPDAGPRVDGLPQDPLAERLVGTAAVDESVAGVWKSRVVVDVLSGQNVSF